LATAAGASGFENDGHDGLTMGQERRRVSEGTGRNRRARTAEIYEAFANESMPCDEPWPKKGRLALFKQLMDECSAP
jgi:hypothetical protein